MAVQLLDEQLGALQRDMRARYIEVVWQHMRACFPDAAAALNEAQVRQRIDEAIERALRYDIREQRDVCIFADALLVAGPDFDEGAEAQAILRDAATSPRTRAAALLELAVTRSRRA